MGRSARPPPKDRAPLVLTINGKAELVVQDAAAYDDAGVVRVLHIRRARGGDRLPRK
jgi:hypothetical protein